MDSIDIIYIDDDAEFDKVSKKEETNENLFDTAYSAIDKYNTMKNDLKKCVNELNVLKIKKETLETENSSLIKKVDKLTELNKINENEIKTIRKQMIENNKNNLMLKTFLDLIIKKYGTEEISRVTKINPDQLNKYIR